jgi:ATP-binding cassette, subfamily B, bacterial
MRTAVAGGGLLRAVCAAGDGRLTMGDVSAFIASIAALQAALATLVTRVATVYQTLLLYDHYRAVLRAELDLPIAATPGRCPRCNAASSCATCGSAMRRTSHGCCAG